MRVQSWRQRAGLAVVLVGTATCSSAPRGPFFGDEQFLVLGVSPEEEANAVSKRLATDGRKEYLRLRGPSFTALGFEERDGRPGWVRGITQRGIELALDPVPSHALERGVRYELLAPETPGLFDADGDGFDELIVLKRSYDWDDPCVLAYRLQGTGFVDLITDGSHTLDVARDAITGVEPCVGTAPADGGVLEDPGEVEAEAEAASPKVRQEPGPEPEPAASPPQ
jgi:hypothetical protein